MDFMIEEYLEFVNHLLEQAEMDGVLIDDPDSRETE